MNKFLSVAIMLLISIATQAQTLKIGTCDTDVEGKLTYTGEASGVGYATQFQRFKMVAYVGCELHSVSIHLQAAAKGKAFVTTSLTSTTRLAEQSFTAYDGGWIEVVFEKPWTVSSKTVYVGYELDKAPWGVIEEGSPLYTANEYVNTGSGWTQLQGACGMMYFTVSGANVPNNDIALGTLNMPNVMTTGKASRPTAEIINLGAKPVTSLEVTYHVNGDTDLRTATVSGLNIASRKSGLVTLPELTFGADGDYNVVTEVTAVNGATDAAPVDNTSSTKLIYARGAMPERKILMEVFSTERCTGCPEGHETIEKTLGKKTNIIEIGHHAGFYTDPLTIPASTAYEWFYKTPEYTTSYAPAVMMDRTNMKAIHGSSFAMDVPLFEPSAARLNAAYNTQNVEPGYATIEIKSEKLKVNSDGSWTLKVDVDAELAVVLSEHTNPVLNVFVTEDSVFSVRQESAKGNYWHRNVARACLTPIWGDAIDVKSRKISASYTVEVPETWREKYLSVVAFVSNYDKSSNSKCKVLNAEKVAACANDTTTGIQEVKSEKLKVKSTSYFNLNGVESSTPHRGVNIVVKRLENGVIITRKQQY